MKAKFLLTYLLVHLFFLNSIVKAQEFDVQLTPSLYAGGYNISCNGASNGSINLFITGGTAPYTFMWLDGPTIRNRTNLGAGFYQVLVTSSNGQSLTREIILSEPEIFGVDAMGKGTPAGYHITEFGGSDGLITTAVRGGVPPYSYLWSNGGNSESLADLTAGTYSVTLHDATNCVTSATVTLTEPTALHVVSIVSPKVVGNYNISCNTAGSIQVSIAGGTPPYSFNWLHGATTKNVNDLIDPGFYKIFVTDSNGAVTNASLTLTKAPVLLAEAQAFTYQNGKNTSCYTCNNGHIAVNVSGGVAPYSFSWNNGSTVQNPANLGAGLYSVLISDVGGCAYEKVVLITSPDREVWTMSGNSGSNPTTQFIGTKDSTDFVFKANNVETIRLLSNGGTKFTGDIFSNSFKLGTPSSSITLAEKGTSGSIKLLSFGETIANHYQDNLEPIHQWAYQYKGAIDAICPTNSGAFMRIVNTCGEGSIDNWHYTTASTTSQDHPLLLNYYSGNDVALCANPDKGGKVIVGSHFEVGYPFPSSPTITTNIRGNSQTGLRVETATTSGGTEPTYNTELAVQNIGTKILGGFVFNNLPNVGGYFQNVFSINGNGQTSFGDNSNPSFFIKPFIDPATFQYQPANIGIGTDNPQARLHIEGNIRIASLQNGQSTFNLIQANADGDLSTITQGDLNTLIPSISYWQPARNK